MAKQTVKPIEFSEHASKRMLQRGLSINQVTGAVRCPTRVIAGNTDYTKRFERDFPNGRFLVVIAEECDDCLKVVTAYWPDE